MSVRYLVVVANFRALLSDDIHCTLCRSVGHRRKKLRDLEQSQGVRFMVVHVFPQLVPLPIQNLTPYDHII